MSTDISLKEIERKAYRSTFQDGLWDIYLGLLLLGFAFASPIESIGLTRPLNILPVVIIPILFLRYGKKLITIPRMGMVRFGPKRKADKKRLRIVSIILFFVTLIQVILTITRVFPPRWMVELGTYSVPIIIALFAVLVFSVFAYFRDFPRLFGIGVLFAAGILFSEYLHYRIGSPYDGMIGFGVPAVIILAVGFVLLLQFLKKYPRPVISEVPDGN
jgi:hypothetical protein